MAGGFKELKAWQKGMDLAEATYALCEKLPASERFSLIDQMRRAAVSVPSNIAEGHGRQSKLDFKRHLKIALGSASELETQILLATRLKFLPLDEAKPSLRLLDEVSRLIWGLLRSDLKPTSNAGTDHSRLSSAVLAEPAS